MAKNNKKISISSFEDAVKQNFSNIETIEWRGIHVSVKKTLPLVDMMSFVSEVVDSCFSDEGEYMPEIMSFAIKSSILSRYAGFSLPSDIDRKYALIYASDVVDAVCSVVNQDQLGEIIESINKRIRLICDSDIISTRNSLKTIIDQFSELQDKFSGIFDSLTAEDVSAILNASNDGSLDEEKLVRAFLKHNGSESDKVIPFNGN